ncbi:MAG: DUF1127 domain-containing protein [Pseudomonadota bacterium]|jgi:uncharacterized protein YjiS (DUF1127 family)
MNATQRALMNVSGLDLLGFFERIGRWFTRIILRSVKLVRQWNRNQKTRRTLLNMSDHMLKDIGITRVDALQEGRKVFWRE